MLDIYKLLEIGAMRGFIVPFVYMGLADSKVCRHFVLIENPPVCEVARPVQDSRAGEIKT